MSLWPYELFADVGCENVECNFHSLITYGYTERPSVFLNRKRHMASKDTRPLG
jgi:hypothetical protein